MKHTSKQLALAVSAVLAMAASANAQNPTHNVPDLVLTFQNPGGAVGSSNTLIAVGGTTGPTGSAHASSFRDAVPGSFTLLTNVNSALVAAFGANWAEEPTLYMAGLVNRGTSDTLSTLLTLDPQRTLYYTRARNSIGTVGEVNSIGVNIAPDSSFAPTTSGMAAIKANLEAGSLTPTFQNTANASAVDDQLPFNSPGNQGAAFGIINGGIQDGFFAGTLGAFGAAGEIELALDLYRSQARNTIAGQYGFGEPIGVGKYLGTLSINTLGDVGFTAAAPIPEPSTALVGLTALLVGAIRRRKIVA